MPTSLTTRTVMAVGLLAAFVAAMFLLMLSSVNAQDDAAGAASASEARISAAVSEQKLLLDIETAVRGYVATGDRNFLEPYSDARAQLPLQERRLRELERQPADALALSRIESRAADYVYGYAAPLANAARPERARRTAVLAEGKREMDALRGLISGYEQGERAEAGRAAASSTAGSRKTLKLAVGGLLSSVLLALLVAVYQLRSVLAPVRRVGAGARRIAGGDLSARVVERGAGEVEALGESFNLMAASIEHGRDELQRFHTFGSALAIEREIEPLAARILQELGDVTSAEVGALYAYVVEAGAAALVGVRGLDRGRLPMNLAPGDGLAGRALAERLPITVSHAGGRLMVPTLGGEMPVTHEAHVPLVQGDRTVGVVTLGRVGETPFTQADMKAIAQLVERAAVGVSAAVALRTLRNQAAVNRAVLDSAVDAFMQVDGSGTVVEWNSAAEGMFGRPAEEMLGARMIEKIVPDRFRGHYTRLLEQFGSTGSWPVNDSRELTALHADGSEFTVEATISPLRVGEHWLFNAFVRDTTDRKRADAYRDAQHRVTRGLADATSLEDARDVVLHELGPALGFSFGATLVPAEGDTHLQVSGTWSGSEGAYQQLAATAGGLVIGRGEGPAGHAWKTGEPVFAGEVAETAPASELQRAAAANGLKSGVAFPVLHGDEFLGAGVFYWEREQALDPELLTMLAAVGAQVGQFIVRKRAEAEAERLKDEFFALVSHELRTPLTSIIGYLELVLEDETLETDPRRFLEVVQRNADRLLRLVGDLLFVAQFEAGNLSLEPRSVDLAHVCYESVEAASPKAQARDIELVLDADHVPAITADAGRLGQAIDNLVSNALKFTPAGGRVEVRLSAVGDEVLIEVADSGTGISADEQARLFDRFFRSAQAHEQAVQGVGLGLTIVKAIVDGHGGRIAVRSEVGYGSTFTVALPLGLVASSHELTETHIEMHS